MFFPSYVFILLFTLSPQSPIESQANQPAAQLSCAFLSFSHSNNNLVLCTSKCREGDRI